MSESKSDQRVPIERFPPLQSLWSENAAMTNPGVSITGLLLAHCLHKRAKGLKGRRSKTMAI